MFENIEVWQLSIVEPYGEEIHIRGWAGMPSRSQVSNAVLSVEEMYDLPPEDRFQPCQLESSLTELFELGFTRIRVPDRHGAYNLEFLLSAWEASKGEA